jgi:hypothetical protein
MPRKTKEAYDQIKTVNPDIKFFFGWISVDIIHKRILEEGLTFLKPISPNNLLRNVENLTGDESQWGYHPPPPPSPRRRMNHSTVART